MSPVPVARPYAGMQSLLLAAEPLVRRYEPCEANRFIETDSHDVPNLTSGIALDSKKWVHPTKL